MPTACTFCGSTLNVGLKFCVVCGRHASTEITRVSGLRSGIRSGDSTRRLDEVPATRKFNRVRKSYYLHKNIHILLVNFLYMLIGLGLFYCAIRLVLETPFSNRAQRVIIPLFGKHPLPIEDKSTSHNKTSKHKTNKLRIVKHSKRWHKLKH